ncbi:MAG: hypothetical protein M3494_12275, partial [Actinomycetota bacterium]|nr:hypothetical protein [Actinomycetota bacterium]
KVAVAMALLEFSQLLFVFGDRPWIVYVWHGRIMPLINLNGMSSSSVSRVFFLRSLMPLS